MVMKEEREERDGRRTGRAVKHDRASDGERRVRRPRRIVPLGPSLCKACEQDSSAMPALRDVACHIRTWGER